MRRWWKRKPDRGLLAALHISSGAASDPHHDRSTCDTCKLLGWAGGRS